MESHLAVAMVAMESAKRRLLILFEMTHPHMLDEQERRKWGMELHLAKLSISQAEYEVDRALTAPWLQPRTDNVPVTLSHARDSMDIQFD